VAVVGRRLKVPYTSAFLVASRLAKLAAAERYGIDWAILAAIGKDRVRLRACAGGRVESASTRL